MLLVILTPLCSLLLTLYYVNVISSATLSFVIVDVMSYDVFVTLSVMW